MTTVRSMVQKVFFGTVGHVQQYRKVFRYCWPHAMVQKGFSVLLATCNGTERFFGTVPNWYRCWYLILTDTDVDSIFTHSQTCVKNSVHKGGVSQHALGQTPPGRHPQQTPPRQIHTPADYHCNGRCTKYWNAFLFIVLFLKLPCSFYWYLVRLLHNSKLCLAAKFLSVSLIELI